MTNTEILKKKIKEKFGDTELINKYVYEQCVIAGVLEAMDEVKNLQQPDIIKSVCVCKGTGYYIDIDGKQQICNRH